MPRPSRSHEIQHQLLAHVEAHPTDLVKFVAADLGLSKVAVATQVQHLLMAGYLKKSGTTRPHYSRGPNQRAEFIHRLNGLAEDRVWTQDVAPLLVGLPANVREICHHGLTKMVNNAIDHSEGRRVRVLVDRNTTRVGIVVSDDGIGIFRKITRALSLPDERLALLELSKGKLTTAPREHSGEGVFFTSRMFDVFQIFSGDLVFDHNDADADDLLYEFDAKPSSRGTTVRMEIHESSQRTVKGVFDQFSSGPDDYNFAKTVVPVRLAKIGDELLVSRSQAKRLLQRVERFSTVVLDFSEVSSIGQAFADEVFRVFANEHPNVELLPINAAPYVQQMIRRAENARDESSQLSLFRDKDSK